jgi:membrane protein implicated in regulation of membrane protease activity
MPEAHTLWFLLGAALLLSEFVVPGLVVAFFGVGAWITAMLTWMGIISDPSTQAVVFAVSSLVVLFLLRRYLKEWFSGGEVHGGDTLDDEFIGKEVRVLKDIPGGHELGKVELKGAEWRAISSTPIPAGALARVIERKDLSLIVEPIN